MIINAQGVQLTRNMQGILIGAVALIVLATFFNSAFVVGGSGVVLLVALGYSYVVRKREIERGDLAASEDPKAA